MVEWLKKEWANFLYILKPYKTPFVQLEMFGPDSSWFHHLSNYPRQPKKVGMFPLRWAFYDSNTLNVWLLPNSTLKSGFSRIESLAWKMTYLILGHSNMKWGDLLDVCTPDLLFSYLLHTGPSLSSTPDHGRRDPAAIRSSVGAAALCSKIGDIWIPATALCSRPTAALRCTPTPPHSLIWTEAMSTMVEVKVG
jgi:hypothetical protein